MTQEPELLRYREPRELIGPQWYAARVQPQMELSVAKRLGSQFPCYSPQFLMDGKPFGPVFRSYVFFELDMGNDSWATINDDRHVIKLLPLHRAYPVAINRELIDDCREREKAGAFLMRSRLTLGYKKGDPVRVHYGPFEGVSGIKFIQQSGAVARLVTTIFNRLTEISVPVAQLLEPA